MQHTMLHWLDGKTRSQTQRSKTSSNEIREPRVRINRREPEAAYFLLISFSIVERRAERGEVVSPPEMRDAHRSTKESSCFFSMNKSRVILVFLNRILNRAERP